MNKAELLDYLKESEGMKDFDETKSDVYYERYCELLPRLKAIKVIGGALASKALDMQIAVYRSDSKPDQPTNPDEMVNYNIEVNDGTIKPVEASVVLCDCEVLPSLTASNTNGYIFECTSESIVEKTSTYMRRLIVTTMNDSTVKDVYNTFVEIIENFSIIEENIRVYGENLGAMLEAMSNSDSTSCTIYSVRSNPDMKLDVTGLPDGILRIIDSIVESEPDIDPDECLELAKAYWYEKHGEDVDESNDE